jgi:hypothetical protein
LYVTTSLVRAESDLSCAATDTTRPVKIANVNRRKLTTNSNITLQTGGQRRGIALNQRELETNPLMIECELGRIE